MSFSTSSSVISTFKFQYGATNIDNDMEGVEENEYLNSNMELLILPLLLFELVQLLNLNSNMELLISSWFCKWGTRKLI